MNRPPLLAIPLACGLLAYFITSLWLPALRAWGEGALWMVAGVLIGYHVRPVDDRRKSGADRADR